MRRAGALALAAVATVGVVAACGGGGSSSTSNGKTVLNEIDYFTSGGSDTAMKWYIKKFEAEHPDVTVKRDVVPFANLITKVL
jgi:ABC-type glycerol-3-phosphate transport system substrate-binding protein